MTENDIRILANVFFDSIESGDVERVVKCYSPDATIWHNTDQIEQTPHDNAKTLAGMVKRITDRIYDDRRLEVFPGGFFQRHILRGTRVHDGEEVSLPACVVCYVDNNRITRLEEYFDSAHVTQFRKYAHIAANTSNK